MISKSTSNFSLDYKTEKTEEEEKWGNPLNWLPTCKISRFSVFMLLPRTDPGGESVLAGTYDGGGWWVRLVGFDNLPY